MYKNNKNCTFFVAVKCQNDELPERIDTALIRTEEMGMFLQVAFYTTLNLAQNPKNKSKKSKNSVFWQKSINVAQRNVKLFSKKQATSSEETKSIER